MKPSLSKALEVNIAEYRVDVEIDPKYHVLQEVMSKYGGLQNMVHTFLQELCHPRKNWQFIVAEARKYSLGYFFDLKSHSKGPEAVRLYVDIAVEGIEKAGEEAVSTDAYHNLYLLIQKCIKDSGEELPRFLAVIDYGFERISQLPPELFTTVAKSYYQVSRLGRAFLEHAPSDKDFHAANALQTAFLQFTFSYWLKENDPLQWFEEDVSGPVPPEIARLFSPVSQAHLIASRAKLLDIIGSRESRSSETMRALLEFQGFGDIVNFYKALPGQIFEAIDDEKIKHQYKLIFLFHSMAITGLSNIYEDTLREINRDIAWLIEHEDYDHVQFLIQQTFRILERNADRYPDTVLKSIMNMGKGVYQTDESDLVNYFNECVVRLGFQTPDFRGISDEWQVQSNLSHIQNIRTWMKLISLNPKWSKKLLSSLIINLSLSGVLIRDTDLFPRDITGFLNSDIDSVYNLSKQLMRLFPAYFNEIGAEGQLRDISTRVDEISQRKDKLIHFMRKQSHVESSNRTISLIESILEYWRSKSKEEFRPFLPQQVYDQVASDGIYIDGVHEVMMHLCNEKGVERIPDLLPLEEKEIHAAIQDCAGGDSIDKERVVLLITFYRLLYQKYNVTSLDIDDYIMQVQSSIPLRLNELRDIVSHNDTYNKIAGLLDYLQKLKDIIQSPTLYKAHEDIYHKRHIAADIPSMYGSYREAKFDALGLTFRLESLVNTLFEDLVEDFDLSFLTQATFHRIYEYLELFHRALNIDGIPARELKNQLDLLKRSMSIKLVTFTQYLDIFRGFTEVIRNLVSEYFHNVHTHNLENIVGQLPHEKLLPKYRFDSDNPVESIHKISETFLRDSISASLGMQRLDLFLTRIVNTLHEQAEKLSHDKHHLLVTYNPRQIVTPVSRPYPDLNNIIHLGNKSLNLIRMKELGMPVPPAFIITTEVFRCIELIKSYEPARKNFRQHIEHELKGLEGETGRTFGSPENALLVSVRSGSAISQPGMMDSYLNVGMNEEIVQGIIRETGEEWFAWDSYRRFLQSYGMSFGIARDEFDAIINGFKTTYGVPLKKELSPDQMKAVCMAYREHILAKDVTMEEAPLEQLYIAISRVIDSWSSEKAKTYRRIMEISDDWGTAVTVQAMVFGNISQQSGSGVLFTHSPKYSADRILPWGDYTIGNQGEDVVSGLVTTYPLSIYQAMMENRPVDYALEIKFPGIYTALRDYAKVMVYENHWAPQDIEFTFESPDEKDLYILQTRNMDMRERKALPTFQSSDEMAEKLLGHGIGVGGGALSGLAVFNLNDISQWKKAEPGVPLILIRNDTVADDIKEISAADGLLTARGGATSHAAIVANRLEKTCVVGCRDLVCMEQQGQFVLNKKTVHTGEFISIDGSSGSIYLGTMQIREGGD
ncbi:MAG: hypothetical protein JSV11_08890 [Nitrospiraceae bacterium]|nr:MAG: hypothetical protein JSV11_08890 [Nitrospiraceae bacterium]